MQQSAVQMLNRHVEDIQKSHMSDWFDQDINRFSAFSLRFGNLLLDYSKNQINRAVFLDLMQLARESGVEERRSAMFAGAKINATEKRSVLHMALRAPLEVGFAVEGEAVGTDVHQVLSKMAAFAEAVRAGTIVGITGHAFTDIVNIGIGGSDLGPQMVTTALFPFHDGPKCHYVSNIDGAHLHDVLTTLNPETTLFLTASKTFTTQETMTNAASARQWLSGALGEASVSSHFAAISTNLEKVADFGIKPDRVFGFWDWVGGRYSVWSAIGLSVMMAIGSKNFRAFLAGAHEMDCHFRDAPLEENMPVILAMMGVWYRNFLKYPTHAILPYDQRMARFPAYLQQLDMESNGKRVDLEGQALTHESGPIVWGEPGTNGQHAFYQLIQQGTDIIPCDFLLAANPQEDMGDHHAILTANCFAQSEALMRGKSLDVVTAELKAAGKSEEEIIALAPHKVFPGNRPSNTLLYSSLDPVMLGRLIALYEHKVFVQGVVWGINSFDQWGVELGKELARGLLPMVRDQETSEGKDVSTRGLIDAYHAMRR